MLSYKLKHICSRVIASLSAVGIISIAHSNDAAAKDLGTAAGVTYAEPGDSFKYNVTSDMSLNADYKEIPTGCSMELANGNDGNFKSYEYASGTTGASGKAQCTYTCKDGYTWGDTTNTSGIAEGRAGYANDLVVPEIGCVLPKLSCSVGNNYSGTISNATSGVNASGVAYCTWTCKAGYSVDGGRDTTTTFTGAKGEHGEQFPTAQCKARQFEVKFDCGTSGYYNGTSLSTGVATATYGQTFTVPATAVCTKEGYTFSGWAK